MLMSEKSFFRKAAKAIADATHVIIGAGAGLSEASGIEMGGAYFTNNSGIISRSMAYRIYIAEGFILFQLKRNAGHSGRGISGSAAIKREGHLCTAICWNSSKTSRIS